MTSGTAIAVAEADTPRATYFDDPDRQPFQQCRDAARVLRAQGPVRQLLENRPDPVCVLNSGRQIVFANDSAAALLRAFSPMSEPVGYRLGEILHCVHAWEGPGGCGTSRACRHCGAGKANFAFGRHPGCTYEQEFRARCMTNAGEQALTYRIHIAPLEVAGSLFRVCTFTDLTAVKTREVLDRLFFHDVLNTCQAVRGAADLLPLAGDVDEQQSLVQVVRRSAVRLIEELEAHRDLARAEDGSLVVAKEPASVGEIVRDIAALYNRGSGDDGGKIRLDLCGDDTVITSAVHLRRCVMNLVKNAIEAGGPDDSVTITTRPASQAISIEVHNPTVMSEAVQTQVFQRSFSTKAKHGRGLGTYGVRLLIERYLAGRVDFTSAPGAGTTFTLIVPRADAGNDRESGS